MATAHSNPAVNGFSGAWSDIGDGPADFTISFPGGRGHVAAATSAPSDSLLGHPVAELEKYSFRVESGAKLYARGSNGICVLSKTDL